jgi:hypothetical protein
MSVQFIMTGMCSVSKIVVCEFYHILISFDFMNLSLHLGLSSTVKPLFIAAILVEANSVYKVFYRKLIIFLFV